MLVSIHTILFLFDAYLLIYCTLSIFDIKNFVTYKQVE